jgi:DNA-binding beta-propeller fold protein YncE
MRYYLAVAAALAMQVSAANADSIVALVGEDILATIDTKTNKATGLTKIDGVGPILGVDVRPADGQLYALASDGTIAIVDALTGKAAPKSKLDSPLPEGVRITVDFNPVADKLRIIGSDGTNLRADVDAGKVTQDKPLQFAQTDAAAGQTPFIIAGAYSNSVKGTKETTLYDIDGALGAVFRQAPPNDGILNTIGMTGLDVDAIGFDIVADGAGGNTAMLVAKGNLYTVDLTSGKAGGGKTIAGLPSGVRDIAVLPAPVRKQAANMMGGDAVGVKPGAETTSGYLPKAMPSAMGGKPMQMKASVGAKMDMPKKVQYSAPKVMKKGGPQCDERKAQY